MRCGNTNITGKYTTEAAMLDNGTEKMNAQTNKRTNKRVIYI